MPVLGDASWGTVLMGRNLGVFGSDAIASDMTLMGVGVSGPVASAATGNSTLGRIGSGYMYANWYGQIAYTTPNWNGFQVTAAVIEPVSNGATGATTEDMGYQGKATYDFAANDVTGRVWVGGLTQKHATGIANTADAGGYTSRGWEIGAKAAYQGAQLVGYYYDGRGLDSQYSNTTVIGTGGILFGSGFKTKDSGGYVQGTFVVPGIGTKLGASWGINTSEGTVSSISGEIENESWVIGAYHPLTKSLNLVAEYTNQEITLKGRSGAITGNYKSDSDTFSLGAMLSF
jgi:predicted porin